MPQIYICIGTNRTAFYMGERPVGIDAALVSDCDSTGLVFGRGSNVIGRNVIAKPFRFFKTAQLGPCPTSQLACGRFDVPAIGSWLLATALGLLVCDIASAVVTKGEISRVGDATHLEFRGLSQWPYEMKKTAPNKYVLKIPAVDDATVAALNTWSDSLVSQVQVDKNGTDGSYLVTFILSDPKVESFDYLTDDPNRLIIDFYKPTPAEAKAQEVATANIAGPMPKKGAKKSAAKIQSVAVEKDSDGYQKKASGKSRAPAGDERLQVGPIAAPPESNPVKGGAYDAADPSFSRLKIADYEISDLAIIASRKNIYIKFPALKLPVSILPQLEGNLPEFIINPRDDHENKQARLLLELYTRQISKTSRTQDRIGAFMKVYENFQKIYPNSEYDEIVKHLAAHMYFVRYQRSGDPVDYEKSFSAYKYLLAKFPQSALAERTQQWLAFSELERKNGLAAIQELQEYLRRYPNSEIKDQAMMAIAEAGLILNKYDDAKKVYEDLEVNAVEPKFRVEATFRTGDVAFGKGDWAEAEKTYRRAMAKYPLAAKQFPNAYFNLAETLFWQRRHKESLDAYVEFLNQFPDHTWGGYAMTRAGELLEAMGADRTRVIGAYLESYFRYRGNPGAEVARVRMLSQQMKSMNDKELRKAIDEMNTISNKSPLPTANEFVRLMIADGYQRRGENDNALKELITFFQANPTSTNLDLFRARIDRNISETLQAKTESGKFLEVLQTKAKFSRTWLKNSDRMDVPFMVGRAYEEAGAYTEAQKYYQDVLDRRQKIVGTEGEKERKVNEILPSVETLRLRLAAVGISNRQFPEAYGELEKLRDSTKLSPKENNERTYLLSKVFRERGQLDKAKAQLTEFISQWKGEPTQLVGNILELAELQLKSDDAVESERQADQVIQMRQLGAKLSDAHLSAALEIKGQALQKQKKDLAAVETYQQLLDGFEGQRPLGSIRYRVGEILFERGDLAGAEKIWRKLDPEKYSVLKRLAAERLESARWQSDHRKYIKRIPAMSGFKEE